MSFKDKTIYQELIRTTANTWLMIKQHAKLMLADMDYDLTFEQVLVLHILAEEEGLNLGEIAEKADRERTTISRMVDGLEKRNLVVRIPDKIDNRQKLLYLTNLGKEQIEQMIPMENEFHEEIYRGISNKEIESCLKTLQKMLANLEKK